MRSHMHDWVLNEIRFDWRSARSVIEFKDSASLIRSVIADGVTELHVSRVNEWGTSVNVNEVFEIEVLTSGLQQLKIEMQSGDVIQIVATQFVLPGT